MSDSLIDAIDAEIEKRQQVRALLAKTGQAGAKAAKLLKPKAKKHTMTAEGRARIAAAQKKRWAAKRRADAQVIKAAVK